jgi:ABC-type Na+ efflux pump permease subunit
VAGTPVAIDDAAPRPGPDEGPNGTGANQPGRGSQTALVASLTFRDLLRRPGGWVATLCTAVLFALLIGAVGLASASLQGRAEDRSFHVVMGGDLDGARGVIDELRADPRLVLTPSTDPAGDVTASVASAGVVFPPGTDAELAAGHHVEVALYRRASANSSTEAYNSVLLRLQAIERARASGQTAPVALGGPQVTVVELPRDATRNRIELARELAPVAALLCIGVVTAVASVLGAARERRTLEPLLVLPLRRDAIAAGIAGGAFPLAVLQIVAGVALLVLTAAIPGTLAHQDPATVIAMALAGTVAAVLLALVASGFGCLAGSLGTGSDDAVSMGDLVAVLFVIVGVITFLAPAVGTTPVAFAVPILGQVLVVRDAVAGTLGALDAVVALASALVTVALLVRVASRRIDDDRHIART